MEPATMNSAPLEPLQYYPSKSNASTYIIVGVLIFFVVGLIGLGIGLYFYFQKEKEKQKQQQEQRDPNRKDLPPLDINAFLLFDNQNYDRQKELKDGNMTINGIKPNKTFKDVTEDECAKKCLENRPRGKPPLCKSFVYSDSPSGSVCELFFATPFSIFGNQAIISDPGKKLYDFFEGPAPYGSTDKFYIVPDSYLKSNNLQVRSNITSAHECAKLCVIEFKDKCRSFDYNFKEQKCYISDVKASSYNRKDEPKDQQKELGKETGTIYSERVLL